MTLLDTCRHFDLEVTSVRMAFATHTVLMAASNVDVDLPLRISLSTVDLGLPYNNNLPDGNGAVVPADTLFWKRCTEYGGE